MVSEIARVEVVSAIRRLAKEQNQSTAGQLLEAEFMADWNAPRGAEGHLASVGLRTHVIERAAEIVGDGGLRSLDAIQLASALLARESGIRISRFVTFDRRLAMAAKERDFLP